MHLHGSSHAVSGDRGRLYRVMALCTMAAAVSTSSPVWFSFEVKITSGQHLESKPSTFNSCFQNPRRYRGAAMILQRFMLK
jgi:hypothetical protein